MTEEMVYSYFQNVKGPLDHYLLRETLVTFYISQFTGLAAAFM